MGRSRRWDMISYHFDSDVLLLTNFDSDTHAPFSQLIFGFYESQLDCEAQTIFVVLLKHL